MSFPNIVYGREAETFTTDATQGAPVGTKMITEDGREFRYCKNNSSTAMIVANLQQGAIPEVAKYGDQACGTIAAGATSITAVAATTTDMAVNDLINGYCWSEQTTQLGPAQRIKDNTVITQGAETGTITLYEGLAIAIGASDTISYIRNTWQNVIIAPATTETGLTCGVSVCALGASEWGWVLTHGPAKCQTSGTPAVSNYMMGNGAAAGEIKEGGAAGDTVVAWFMHWEQANEDGLFFFVIE
jgi:hypothetical protein